MSGRAERVYRAKLRLEAEAWWRVAQRCARGCASTYVALWYERGELGDAMRARLNAHVVGAGRTLNPDRHSRTIMALWLALECVEEAKP